MQQLNLQPLPSQTLTYLDTVTNQWQISAKLTETTVAFSFTLNGTILVQNITAVAGFKMIPYDYIVDSNFILITQNQEIPDYNKFGVTQFLLALSADEIAALKAPFSVLDLVTNADFDPRGDFPLRYKPQGYILA